MQEMTVYLEAYSKIMKLCENFLKSDQNWANNFGGFRGLGLGVLKSSDFYPQMARPCINMLLHFLCQV